MTAAGRLIRRRAGRIRAVVVAIPARDEEALLPACLATVTSAVRLLPSRVRTVVVVAADRCSDATAEVGRAAGATVLELAAGSVGAARAAAIAAGLEAVGTDAPRTWIATTDADTLVPADWLTAQLRLADAGTDLLLGTVQPPIDELEPELRAVWLRTHPPHVAAGRIHGANLGVRADAYTSAGGFAPLPVHEDVDLVRRLREGGVRERSSAAFEVLTSARLQNRVPGGFAGFLRDELPTLDAN